MSSERRVPAWAGFLLAVVALGAPACNFDPPRLEVVTQPRQLWAARLPAALPVLQFTADGKGVLYSSSAADPEKIYRSFSLSLLRLEDGRDGRVADRVTWYAELLGLGEPGRAAPIAAHQDDNRLVLYSPETSQTWAIDGVLGEPVVAGGRLVVRRFHDGRAGLWAGPPDNLAPVELGLDVTQLEPALDAPDGAREVLVRGWKKSPEGVREEGIFRVDLDTARLTLLARNEPQATTPPGWLSGPPPAPPRHRLAFETFFQHCWPGAPSGPRRCALFVRRIARDDRGLTSAPQTEHAYLLLRPQEESELYLGKATGIRVVFDAPYVTWHEPLDAAELTVLNLETGTTRQCKITNANGAVFTSAAPGGRTITLGWHHGGWSIESQAADACVSLPGRELGEPLFSPSGQRLVWIDWTGERAPTLWQADGQGRSPRVVAEHLPTVVVVRQPGELPRGPAFAGDDLYLHMNAYSDGNALTAYDLTQMPARERPLAAQISFSGWQLVTARWLLVGTGFELGDDRNGVLALVDTQSGENVALADAVTEHWMASSLDAQGRPRTEIPVVYVVRTRNPSARDGVWTFTIRPGDLPR